MLFTAGYHGTLSSTLSLGTAAEQQQPQKEVGPACIADTESGNEKDNAKAEVINLSNRYGA